MSAGDNLISTALERVGNLFSPCIKIPQCCHFDCDNLISTALERVGNLFSPCIKIPRCCVTVTIDYLNYAR